MDVPGVRQGKSFEGAVMVKGEAKEFGGDRVGFGVIEEGESGDKEAKVFAMVVFVWKIATRYNTWDE